jgi:hypothetical protein
MDLMETEKVEREKREQLIQDLQSISDARNGNDEEIAKIQAKLFEQTEIINKQENEIRQLKARAPEVQIVEKFISPPQPV